MGICYAIGFTMIRTESLTVGVGDVEILKNVDVSIPSGEIHAVMGPNGSGKSTLCHAVMGNPVFNSTGSIYIDNEEITNLLEDERSKKGLFQSFQYPVGLPGVTLREFVHSINNEISEDDINQLAREYGVEEFLSRDVNIDLSGGEKKRSELFQLATMKPKGILLDEIDSGLDIDALRRVSDGVNALRSKERAFLIITHYQRLLDYIKPDFVHVLVDGKITKTGCVELALELEKVGYEEIGARK